jgi:hypothetical protein
LTNCRLLDLPFQLLHTPPTMITITPAQLRKAADIQEKIQSLQKELGQLLGSEVSTPVESAETPKKLKTRKMSAAGRAAIAAAARARWAKIKGTAVSAKSAPTPKKKRKMTAAWRKALERAWAARRAKRKAATSKP